MGAWEKEEERGRRSMGEGERERECKRKRELIGKSEICPMFLLCSFVQTKCFVLDIFSMSKCICPSLTRMRSLWMTENIAGIFYFLKFSPLCYGAYYLNQGKYTFSYIFISTYIFYMLVNLMMNQLWTLCDNIESSGFLEYICFL